MAFRLFPSQLPQGNTKAYPVTATDVAVDDDGGNGDMTRAGAAFPFRTKLLMDLNIWGAKSVEGASQIRFRMRVYLRSQVARIEQHEFGGAGLGGAHLNNKILQVVASA